MAAIPAADIDPTHAWLDALYGNSEEGWISLFSLDRSDGTRHVDWAPVGDIDALTAKAHARAATCCVWFGVAPRTGNLGSQRGGANDCTSIPALWLDVDIATGTHARTDLPPDIDAARQLIADLPLPPTAIVHTGGGLQAWWVLAEPLEAERALPLLTRWGTTWTEFGRRRGWHVDNVFDIARVMRLPGTQNRKAEPIPVTVIEADWTRRFGHDDLEQFTLDAPAAPEPAVGRSVPYIGPERPGDAFNAVRRGGEMLALVGFVLSRRDRSGDEHWTGPWKEPRQGHSATVYADGHTTIWSDTARERWPSLEVRRPYDPFALYAHLFHAGDWTLASDRLAAEGYGTKAMSADVLAWLAELQEPAADHVRSPAQDEWPDPQPLARPDPPGFPIDTLPAWIAEHALATAERLQVPVDLCAMIAIGALSAALAPCARVCLTPSWRQHLNLYLATAMASGAGKSPADKAMGEPLRELEARMQTDHRETAARAKAERKRLEKDVARAEKDGDQHAMATAYLALDDHELPPTPKILVDDATPEALVRVLDAHKGTIAIVSTEAALLDIVCGAYAAGRKPNINVYLQGWGGERVVVNRVGGEGRSSADIVIDKAIVTVAITVQPSVLTELRSHPDLASRGLIPRFMMAMPSSRVGERDRSRSLLGSVDTAAAYRDAFIDIAGRWRQYAVPIDIPVCAAARERWLVWVQAQEPRLGPTGDLAELAEWSAKLQASVLRLAGLLHLADGHDHNREVDDETMARALEVGEYWLAHMRGIFDMWVDTGTATGRRVVEWMLREGLEEISLRDLMKGSIRRTFDGDNDRAIDTLTTLREHGWIRQVDEGPFSVRGRGTPSLRVRLHEQVSARLSGKLGHVGHVASGSMELPPPPPPPPPPYTEANRPTLPNSVHPPEPPTTSTQREPAPVEATANANPPPTPWSPPDDLGWLLADPPTEDQPA